MLKTQAIFWPHSTKFQSVSIIIKSERTFQVLQNTNMLAKDIQKEPEVKYITL